jgi:hypothetical protein
MGLFAAVALAVAISAPASAAGGGTFWLTDGSNGTGDARGFDILPERTVNFAGLLYNSNCGASCGSLDNSVSSIVFSCGVSGVTIDNTDWVKLFTLGGGTGHWVLADPDYPAACSNGRITLNVVNTAEGGFSSMVTNE